MEAVGLAHAKAYQAQVQALGQMPTAVVNAVSVLAEHNATFVPQILVMGGANGGSSLDGLAATLMRYLSAQAQAVPAENPAPAGQELTEEGEKDQPVDKREPPTQEG